jgi:hypothetical protein
MGVAFFLARTSSPELNTTFIPPPSSDPCPVGIAHGAAQQGAYSARPWNFQYCFDCAGLVVGDDSCGFCPLLNTCLLGNASGARDGSCNAAPSSPSPSPSPSPSASPSAGGDGWQFKSCDAASVYGPMSIASLMVYLAFFAPGMGPMPWTINRYCKPYRDDDHDGGGLPRAVGCVFVVSVGGVCG